MLTISWQMLRERLGSELFWTAVQDYVATYSKKVVETDDFRRVLEKHSGLNLNKFFDQFLYSPGYPKLKATFAYSAPKVSRPRQNDISSD